MYAQLVNRDGMSSRQPKEDRLAALALASALGCPVVSTTYNKDDGYKSKFANNGGIVFNADKGSLRGCTDGSDGCSVNEINLDLTLPEFCKKLIASYGG